MQKSFAALLAARGLTLVTDPTDAEKLIQVLFVPDLTDPSTGISYIIGVRNNPGNILTPSAQTSFASYSYTNMPGFSNFGQPQYYGYFNDYPDYGGSSVSTPSGGGSAHPPSHHNGGNHVSRPIDCPPETSNRPSPGYAGNHPPPSHHGGSGDGGGNHWWNSRPSSDYTPSYSSPSYSSSSYSSSSDYVGPTTSYSSSSSNSSPSISFPSSSSSSSSSTPMSMPSSSDSGPRSFGTAPQERP